MLRPGGRPAAFEPEWTSLAISGANPELTARIMEARSRGIASPDVGARLPDLMSEAGFIEVHTSDVPIAIVRGCGRRCVLDFFGPDRGLLGTDSLFDTEGGSSTSPPRSPPSRARTPTLMQGFLSRTPDGRREETLRRPAKG